VRGRWVDAFVEHEGGVAVAEIMDADVGEVVVFDEAPPAGGEAVPRPVTLSPTTRGALI